MNGNGHDTDPYLAKLAALKAKEQSTEVLDQPETGTDPYLEQLRLKKKAAAVSPTSASGTTPPGSEESVEVSQQEPEPLKKSTGNQAGIWGTVKSIWGELTGDYNAPVTPEEREARTDEFLNAIKRGSAQAEQAEIVSPFKGAKLTPENITRVAELQKKTVQLPASKEYQTFNQSEGVGGALSALSKAPAKIIVEITAESLSALAQYGATRMAGGAAIGAALGSVVPGIGTAVGAGAGIVGGMADSSLALEYSGKFMESLIEQGVNVQDGEDLKRGFEDEDIVSKARTSAYKKGIPIAIFDLISGGVAGKIVSKPAKSLLTKIGSGVTEFGVQAGLGGAGEVAGQLTAGEKIKPSSIIAEMIGELGTTPIEVSNALLTFNRKASKPLPTVIQEQKETVTESSNLVAADAAAKVIMENINNLQPGVIPQVTPDDSTPVVNQKPQEIEKQPIKDDVHRFAKEAGISIDAQEFMQKSKELTGKEHLDDMTAEELTKVREYVQEEIQKKAEPIEGGGPQGGIVVQKTPQEEKITKAKEALSIKLKGDALLDANDLVDELADNGGEINEDGTVTLFHRTTDENKAKIEESGKMTGLEDGLFFSTKESGQAEAYGDTVIKLRVPIDKVELDDAFGDEAHVRIPTTKVNQKVDVSKYLIAGAAKTPTVEKASGLATEKKTVAPAPTEAQKIAQAYHEEVRNPSVSAEEVTIAGEIGTVTRKSVEPFGDKNKIEGNVKKYIKDDENAEDLDKIAQRASYALNPNGDGNDISPEQVLAFMEKYDRPHAIYTPAGNPKLKALGEQYQKLTGKGINRKIAKDISDKILPGVANDEANQQIARLLDKDGNLDDTRLLAELEADEVQFRENYGLADENEFQKFKNDLYEEQQAKIGRADRGGDQSTDRQTGVEPVQGGPLSTEFRDTSKDAATAVQEITAKPLSHVPGLGMGKGLSAGTYVSTEEKNRYGEGQTAKVTIKSPFVFLNENLIIPFRNKILRDNLLKFENADYADQNADPFDLKSIDDLTMSGIDRLAELVRNNLQSEGYDSIYLPESETQEGELIVFDAANVQIGEQAKQEPSSGLPASDVASPPATGPPASPPVGPTPDGGSQEALGREELSGIKKALVPEDVVESTEVDKRTTQEVLDQGKADVDSGRINPQAIIAEVLKEGRALQPNEVAALVYYKATLDNQVNATSGRLANATDMEATAAAQSEMDALNIQLDDYHQMSVITANQQSLAFRLRNMLLDSEYNLQSQINKFKAINSGQISPAIEEKFKELDRQLKEANRKIDELRAEQKKKEDDFYFKAIQDAERKARVKLITEEKKKKIHSFFQSLKVDTKNKGIMSASIIPGLTILPHVWNGSLDVIEQTVLAGYDVAIAIKAGIDYIKANNKNILTDEPEGEFNEELYRKEMEPLVRKVVPRTNEPKAPKVKDGKLVIPKGLIKELVASGIADIEELTTAIHDLIRLDLPEITHRQVRDAITQYGKTVSLSQDELDVEIRKMKRVGKLISGLEDVQKKMRPLRSGLQRDKLSDQERQMQRELREAMKELPIDLEEEQKTWKTALDGVKTRLRNQIADLEKQIETGAKTPKKKGIEYDDEALALQTKRDELKKIIEEIEGKPELSDEQKVRMAVKSAEKSIKEYERRIAEKDFKKATPSKTPETIELKELRAKRDAAKEAFEQLKQTEGITDKERLESSKKAVRKSIEEYERRIDEGDFGPKKKRNKPEPDPEARKLMIERERIKNEFDVAQEKNRLKNRPFSEKVSDFGLDVWNLGKTLKASLDFSAALRQGGHLLPSHPISWAKAFVVMFGQAASQKRYDNWINALKASDIYPMVQSSKLFIADTNAKMSAREELFMSHLAKRIPIIGQSIRIGKRLVLPGLDLIGASNRAYSGFLNKLRLDVFASGVDQLQRNGMTFKSHPEEYKGLADFINNSTGRGDLWSLERAAPILNGIFFSPRFLASRINLINPVYYAKLPPAARREAIKTSINFIVFGMVILAIAGAAGAEVEDDPRSADFGKIKIGNIRFDIWAGVQSLVRAIAQIATGQRKNTRTGDVKDANRMETLGRFGRSKLSPSAGTVANVLIGKTIDYQDVTVKGELINNTVPLYLQDLDDTYKNEGEAGVLKTALPSLFGIGVQNYQPKPPPDMLDRILKRLDTKMEFNELDRVPHPMQ